MKFVAKLLLTILVLVSFALVGCGGGESSDPVAIAKKDLSAAFPNPKGPIQTYLNDKDTIILSTAKNDKDSYLIYFEKSPVYNAYIIDKKNNQVAMLYRFPHPKQDSIFNIYNDQYNTSLKRVIYAINILNDKHDKDDRLGIWNGDNTTHYIPLFTTYQFDKDGKMQVMRTTSGIGMTPSHYQGPVQEQYHLDLINIVFDQMDDLRALAREKEIKIDDLNLMPTI